MKRTGYNPDIKRPKQSVFDFIMTNYGSLNGMEAYLIDKPSLLDFSTKENGTRLRVDNIVYDYYKTEYQSREMVVSTGEKFSFGDYNSDFNNDFLIN